MAKKSAREVNRPGQFAYEGLDRVMHEKARLGILTSLVTHSEGLLFNDLKELCSLTDGNLNRHLKTLQEAGMVEVSKRFKDNYPQTLCRITLRGRKRFLEYLDLLEEVVAAAKAREGQEETSLLRSKVVKLAD
ncbi:MAG: transcriptional regulator [Pirellulales bacterium]